jgi:hypothetical protein
MAYGGGDCEWQQIQPMIQVNDTHTNSDAVVVGGAPEPGEDDMIDNDMDFPPSEVRLPPAGVNANLSDISPLASPMIRTDKINTSPRNLPSRKEGWLRSSLPARMPVIGDIVLGGRDQDTPGSHYLKPPLPSKHGAFRKKGDSDEAGTDETLTPMIQANEASTGPRDAGSHPQTTRLAASAQFVPPAGTHDIVLEEREQEAALMPGIHDVVLGKGPDKYGCPGNAEFRKLCAMHKNDYDAAVGRGKPAIARKVIELWRGLNPRGRFVAKEDGVLVEVDEKKAREITSQRLRDSAATPGQNRHTDAAGRASAAAAAAVEDPPPVNPPQVSFKQPSSPHENEPVTPLHVEDESFRVSMQNFKDRLTALIELALNDRDSQRRVHFRNEFGLFVSNSEINYGPCSANDLVFCPSAAADEKRPNDGIEYAQSDKIPALATESSNGTCPPRHAATPFLLSMHQSLSLEFTFNHHELLCDDVPLPMTDQFDDNPPRDQESGFSMGVPSGPNSFRTMSMSSVARAIENPNHSKSSLLPSGPNSFRSVSMSSVSRAIESPRHGKNGLESVAGIDSIMAGSWVSRSNCTMYSDTFTHQTGGSNSVASFAVPRKQVQAQRHSYIASEGLDSFKTLSMGSLDGLLEDDLVTVPYATSAINAAHSTLFGPRLHHPSNQHEHDNMIMQERPDTIDRGLKQRQAISTAAHATIFESNLDEANDTRRRNSKDFAFRGAVAAQFLSDEVTEHA